MDAVRKIMIAVRTAGDEYISSVEDIPDDVFKFNAMLLIEAELVVGTIFPNNRTSSTLPSKVLISRLTWKGCEFACSIKDEAIWEKTKKHILNPASAWTFEILKEYLKQELKEKLGLNV